MQCHVPVALQVIQKTDLTNTSRKSAKASPVATAPMSNDAEPLTAASRQKLPSSLGEHGGRRYSLSIGLPTGAK